MQLETYPYDLACEGRHVGFHQLPGAGRPADVSVGRGEFGPGQAAIFGHLDSEMRITRTGQRSLDHAGELSARHISQVQLAAEDEPLEGGAFAVAASIRVYGRADIPDARRAGDALVRADAPVGLEPAIRSLVEVFEERIRKRDGRVVRDRDVVNVPSVGRGDGIAVGDEAETDAQVRLVFPFRQVDDLFAPVAAGAVEDSVEARPSVAVRGNFDAGPVSCREVVAVMELQDRPGASLKVDGDSGFGIPVRQIEGVRRIPEARAPRENAVGIDRPCPRHAPVVQVLERVAEPDGERRGHDAAFRSAGIHVVRIDDEEPVVVGCSGHQSVVREVGDGAV